MNSKTNLYALILLIFLVQLMLGCGGSRRGWFAEVGGGFAAVAANEEWITHTFETWTYRSNVSGLETFLHGSVGATPSTRRNREIGRTHQSAVAISPSLVPNLKFGYGFSDKLLFSLRSKGIKFLMTGFGVTYFAKKTAPSLLFDIVIPISNYRFSRIDSDLRGTGASIGVGYELKKNLIFQVDFSVGVHWSEYALGSFSGVTGEHPPGPILGPIDTHTSENPRRAIAGSLAFTINRIWY